MAEILVGELRALDGQLAEISELLLRSLAMIDNLLATLPDADSKVALVELIDICLLQLTQVEKSLQEERNHIEALGAGSERALLATARTVAEVVTMSLVVKAPINAM